jgi:hypothetical protein
MNLKRTEEIERKLADVEFYSPTMPLRYDEYHAIIREYRKGWEQALMSSEHKIRGGFRVIGPNTNNGQITQWYFDTFDKAVEFAGSIAAKVDVEYDIFEYKGSVRQEKPKIRPIEFIPPVQPQTPPTNVEVEMPPVKPHQPKYNPVKVDAV